MALLSTVIVESGRPKVERQRVEIDTVTAALARFVSNIERLLLAIPVLIGLLIPASSHAAETSREYRVKGGYLLNFSKFVDWPPTAFAATNTPFVMAVAGDNPFGSDLAGIVAGHTAFGHPIVVRELRCDDPALAECHIVFVSKARDEKSVLRLVADSPVLTVGESDAFLKNGGMMQFCLESGKIRFDINTAATRKAGLQVRAQLLKIAREVHGKESPE